jgi:hypothetical protein
MFNGAISVKNPMEHDPAQVAKAGSGSERRTEKRYEVELDGELRLSDGVLRVKIADLSASGALIMVGSPPRSGTLADLWIPDYGILGVKIMHAGQGFCGVSLVDPAAHRARLMVWLRQEVSPSPSTGT